MFARSAGTYTVPFQPQVQSRVTSNPELNLFAKSSWSQVAHEHATNQGAYLLLLNVILIFLPSAAACYCMSCSQMPFSWYVHEETVLQHTLISHFITIFRAISIFESPTRRAPGTIRTPPKSHLSRNHIRCTPFGVSRIRLGVCRPR
jgi:hypothetical protein